MFDYQNIKIYFLFSLKKVKKKFGEWEKVFTFATPKRTKVFKREKRLLENIIKRRFGKYCKSFFIFAIQKKISRIKIVDNFF